MAHTDLFNNGTKILRRLHSPDGKKTFGYLVLPSNYDGRDPSQVQDFESLFLARIAAGDYDRKKVDRCNGVDIFKVLVSGMHMGYIDEHGNFSEHLTRLRERNGGAAKPKVLHPGDKGYTLPKKAYLQNQPGYDPHSAKYR